MDGPASALDPIATFQVEERFKALRNTYPVVIVTHDMQSRARGGEDRLLPAGQAH